MTTPIRLLLASALLGAWLPAQQVLLQDGRTLVGKTRQLKVSLEVQTLDGKVRVKLSDVVRVRTVEELKKELQRVGVNSGIASSAHGQLELARTARNFGLHGDMWRHLDMALHLGKNKPGVTRRTRDFMAQLEPVVLAKRWRGKKADIWVKEMTYKLNGKLTRAKKETIEELLVRKQGSEVVAALRKRARRAAFPLHRSVAIRALGRRSGEKKPYSVNDRFVYRTAILDSREAVRMAAVDVSQEMGHGSAAIKYLAPGLVHRDPRVRIRTATAFGRLKDEQALSLLVDAGPEAHKVYRSDGGGGSTRAHMAVIEQQAYVRDFNVEVAQAASIADPVIDVLQTGVVLDVTVAAVTTMRTDVTGAYRRALRDITGEDPGSDPRKWRHWLEVLRARQTSKDAPAPVTGKDAKNKER